MTDQVFLYVPLEVLKPDRILSNGRKFPMISFGTSEIKEYENIYSAVDVALETGYRSFDCSPKGKQEEYLGKALSELLPKYDLKRKDIIICCKLHPKDYGADSTTEAFRRSCENLQTDYIDVYSMKWPGGYNIEYENEENTFLREETWKELLTLHSNELIKTLGVCHFTAKQLKSLQHCGSLMPAINQVEFHPRYQQIELMEFCKENKILLQAHGFRETVHPVMTSDSTVRDISKYINKNPTQIVLKWIINKGVAVISQSTSPEVIRENFKIYELALDKPAMDRLNSIKIREKYLPNTICIV